MPFDTPPLLSWKRSQQKTRVGKGKRGKGGSEGCPDRGGNISPYRGLVEKRRTHESSAIWNRSFPDLGRSRFGAGPKKWKSHLTKKKKGGLG